jgi:two-component system, NarL family, nitrate/nitrite response regulator NarL
MGPIRALLVDDHEVFLKGLRNLLESYPEVIVVGSATSMTEARSLCKAVTPDVVVMDVRLPDSRGVIEAETFKAICPGAKVVVLTGYGTAARADALEHGADAFVTKDLAADEIVDRVLSLFPRRARSRRLVQSLSARELEVARLAAQGLSNPEIAEALSISPNTVKTHLANAMDKLNVRDRIGLALAWREQ